MNTQEEINQKHSQACAEAGVIQYRIMLMNEELASKNALIRELNIKASQLMQAESLKKTEQTPDVTSETKVVEPEIVQ